MAVLKRFPLGEIVIAVGASALGIDFTSYLERHQSGDWGDLSEENAEINDLCIDKNFPLVSMYSVNQKSFLIVTEWDRSVTTICTPDEY